MVRRPQAKFFVLRIQGLLVRTKKSDRRYRTRYLRFVRLSVNAFRCEKNRNGLKDGLTQAWHSTISQ